MKLSAVKKIGNLEIVFDCDFTSLGKLSSKLEGQLTFIEELKSVPKFSEKENIKCVIVNRNLVKSIPENIGIAISEKPRESFYKIHNFLIENTDFFGLAFQNEIATCSTIHPSAVISESGVKIGERCIIGPNVTILANTIIEDEVTIKSGCVIGSEGFEITEINNKKSLTKHAGGVLIKNGVSILENSVVCKSLFNEFVVVGENTIIGSSVYISHNVRIGKNCIIAPSAHVGGSTDLGDDVWIGPSATISNQIRIGNNAFISIGSTVVEDVDPYQKVTGNFAMKHKHFLANYYAVKKKYRKL